MGLKPLHTSQMIKDHIEKDKKKWLNQIKSLLISVGEEFDDIARSSHKYKDQSGNLTSSIGYILFYNGKQIASSRFAPILQGSKGSIKGKELAKNMAEDTKGFCLACVAGENYAIFVESKGFDVITGSTQIISNTLKQAIQNVIK